MISRVTRTRQQARSAYDRMSPWYDKIASPGEKPFRERALQLLECRSGDQVLDVGTGTGAALIRIAHDVYPGGSVVGLDVSPGMLSAAARKIYNANVESHCYLVNADAFQLPFCTGKFDGIFMAFTLELFDTPEISPVLAECKRVLSPGGKIVIVSLSKGHTANLPVQLYEWFHHHFPSFFDCRPIPLKLLFEASGFQLIQHEYKQMWGLPVELALGKNG
jgi:ubiquinone/menaquinone biosynthesis C-methylase UbiE